MLRHSKFDKWEITEANGDRIARALWAFAFNSKSRLRATVYDVWLKPNTVRVDVFQDGYGPDNDYAWFVVTWSATDMRRVLHERSYKHAAPAEIASLASDLARVALMEGFRNDGGYQMPLFNIEDTGIRWRKDELRRYVDTW